MSNDPKRLRVLRRASTARGDAAAAINTMGRIRPGDSDVTGWSLGGRPAVGTPGSSRVTNSLCGLVAASTRGGATRNGQGGGDRPRERRGGVPGPRRVGSERCRSDPGPARHERTDVGATRVVRVDASVNARCRSRGIRSADLDFAASALSRVRPAPVRGLRFRRSASGAGGGPRRRPGRRPGS